MSVTSIKPEGGISDPEFMGISTNARKGERAHLLGLLRIRMGLLKELPPKRFIQHLSSG